VEEEKINILKNNLNHIHSSGNSKNIGYAAVIIRAGSRYEPDNLNGLAHFMEHCLFKGTRKRRAHHIINRMEIVGAEMDAYTTKEFTCIYSVFMTQHLERALELLSDIVFHSQFPHKEIEKEKNVVIDEIQSYLDNPAEQIFEDFEEMIFQNHSLAKSILGKVESVQRITSADLNSFKSKFYTPENMVLSTSCTVTEKKLSRLTEKYFGFFNGPTIAPFTGENLSFKSERKKEEKSTFQTHYITGIPAYSTHDEKRNTMLLLNNFLGGPAMNSRLNMNIREKYGYTYHIESGYNAYSDVGLFYIYLGSDKKNINKIERLVYKELTDLKQKKLGEAQFKKAIQQFKGQVSIASESTISQVLNRGKDLLVFGKLKSLEEVLADLDLIGAKDLQNVANEIFDLNNFSRLIFENN